MDHIHFQSEKIKRPDNFNENVDMFYEEDFGKSNTNYTNFKVISKTKVEQPGINLNEHVKEFQLLDEVQGSNSEDDDVLNSNNDDYSSSLDIDESEIENLLDEALPDELKRKKKTMSI